jgi:hypothetical protein
MVERAEREEGDERLSAAADEQHAHGDRSGNS